jgi:hypothetical protein
MPRAPVQRLAVSLPVLFIKEKRMFIAYTPALDLSASGSTMKYARRNFETSLRLFLEELVRVGTLDHVLRDMGWSKQRQQWQPPSEIQTVHYVPLHVPVSL